MSSSLDDKCHPTLDTSQVFSFAASYISLHNPGMGIRSFKPNVSREEAIAQFNSTGAVRWMRELTLGRLRWVADAYLPFLLFRVRILNRGQLEERLFGLDGVSGSLDLYQFEHVPDDRDLISLDTRNHLPVKLTQADAGPLLDAKIRRLIYSRGFFHAHDLSISHEPVPAELHIPYWLGFRGASRAASLSVIDAVRRRPEGAKVRAIFENWLLQSDRTSENQAARSRF